MQINRKITVIFIFFLAVIFLLPHAVGAQADVFGVNDPADYNIALGSGDLRETITNIVNIALGFLGILVTLIILYGGYIWMTSGGNAEKIDRAKRIIINAIIGLIIILSSYAIARFILREGYNGIFGGGPSGPGSVGYSGGSGLGNGVIESHYPASNATGVYRNTNIYVTFKEPMNPEFIVNDTGCGGVNCEARENYIALYRHGDPDNPITNEDLVVSYDPADLTVFEFNPFDGGTVDPDDFLGDGFNAMTYTMFLGNLETGNGQVAFPLGHYSWNFSVGTEFDLTPPTVTSVIPSGEANPYPRNSIVQINFSEAVSPFVALNNIDLINAGASIDGIFSISNQYRTVEFRTLNDCGSNSCGDIVYCLPGDDDGEWINGTVGQAIIDMTGNHLDCADSCDGSNNYVWDFQTNGVVELSAPTISSMQDPDGVSLREPIRVTYDRQLMSSSVNSDNIGLTGGPTEINYWLSLSDQHHTININHERFESQTTYVPTLTSGIKDTLQNCWYICECDADSSSTCYCSNNNVGSDCPGGEGSNCASNN